jgi:hypothetical protein
VGRLTEPQAFPRALIPIQGRGNMMAESASIPNRPMGEDLSAFTTKGCCSRAVDLMGSNRPRSIFCFDAFSFDQPVTT